MKTFLGILLAGSLVFTAAHAQEKNKLPDYKNATLIEVVRCDEGSVASAYTDKSTYAVSEVIDPNGRKFIAAILKSENRVDRLGFIEENGVLREVRNNELDQDLGRYAPQMQAYFYDFTAAALDHCRVLPKDEMSR